MSKLVLLVEDNPDDVLFMERAFTRAEMPFPVRVARDGQQAIDDLSGAGVAAAPAATHILLDVKLPFRSGIEVLEWIRDEPRLASLPVVMLTSSTERADIERAFELGAQSYLVKPVGFPALVVLAKAIRAWVQTGELSQLPKRPTA
jgi:CheY-like chemotaxis protein